MTKTCTRCMGTGQEPDYRAIGKYQRQVRTERGLTLRETARRMGVSPAYLSDLELGRRNFTPRVVARFRRALGLPAAKDASGHLLRAMGALVDGR